MSQVDHWVESSRQGHRRPWHSAQAHLEVSSSHLIKFLNRFPYSILKNPSDEKFRVLKKTNKAIATKIMALQPDGCVILLIEALGYTELDGELHAFTGDYFQILMEGSTLISEASMALRMQTMSADEKEKMEMIKKNQEMFKAK